MAPPSLKSDGHFARRRTQAAQVFFVLVHHDFLENNEKKPKFGSKSEIDWG